ncbi:MAG: ABC transporter permease [Bdellovibrionales bacterium]|nr:ABC transporter permease [Bdellovibrionales bacterium]
MMKQIIHSFISSIGKSILTLQPFMKEKTHQLGEFFLFLRDTVKLIHPATLRYNLVIKHFKLMGVDSFFIISLTSVFTGMVMALQMGRAFSLFQAETLTGAVSAIAVSKELAPVLASLMFTARVGSSMAAQLGTMRVTQQIDALSSMAVNPMDYLILPRFLATVLVLPFLTAMFDFVSMMGSYVVGVKLLHIDHAAFVERTIHYMEISYIVEGIFKAAFFGLIISTVSCFKGFHAKGGAEGVGRVTTQAVVVSSVCVLVSDYFLTALLF